MALSLIGTVPMFPQYYNFGVGSTVSDGTNGKMKWRIKNTSSTRTCRVRIAIFKNGTTIDESNSQIHTIDPNQEWSLNTVVYYQNATANDSLGVMATAYDDYPHLQIYKDVNTAPTTPGAFTSPTSMSLKPGDYTRFEWGASSDANGNNIEYNHEIRFYKNGVAQAWEQPITSSLLARAFTIPTDKTITAIELRVRAYDGQSYSIYRHSPIYQIAHNNAPTLTLATTDNRTLYENDQFNVTGQVTDTDVGNVVTTKYSINGGTERAITATISQGTALTYNKVLTFKQGKLFDGANAITDTLADGSQHVLRVWAEDDKGGKSAEQVRVFYVVANRSAVLTINPVTSASDLIDSDTIAISGNVSDPDGNTVTVRYKIGNGLYTQVYSGTGGTFNFNVALADLQTGVNTVMVQATDSYGLSTTKTLRVTKSANNKPLLKSVATYKLTPPNGSADGIVLWVQRETGDLIVNAEISMGANGAAENFEPMTKVSTAYVSDAIEEDEFTFDNGTDAENIVVRLTMTRTSATSDKAIKLISGVLS